MPGTTPRGAFPYPTPDDPFNPPGDLLALVNRLAAVGALDSQGLESARPLAGANYRGWYYYATDTDHLYRCDGAEWNQIDPPTGLDDTFLATATQHLDGTGAQHGTAGIADGAITSAKIADGTIVLSDLAAAVRELLYQLGDIKWQTHATPPSVSWQIADGGAISRTTFGPFFALIGTRFGPGDGVNTFNKPNLVDSVLSGVATDGAVAQKAAGLSHDHVKTGAVGNGNATHAHTVTVATNNFSTGGKSSGGVDHWHGVNGSTGGANNPGGMSHVHHAVWSADQWSGAPDVNLEHGHNIAFNTASGGVDHSHVASHGHTASTDSPTATHAHTDTLGIAANTAGSVTKLVPFVKVA